MSRTSRSCASCSSPTRSEVGIGTTLRGAIEDSLTADRRRDRAVAGDPDRASPAPTEEPTAEPSQSPGSQPTQEPGGEASVSELLQQAEDKFAQADEAQRQGDTVRWARLMEQGRKLVEQAVGKLG